jgi:hypothetical protein
MWWLELFFHSISKKSNMGVTEIEVVGYLCGYSYIYLICISISPQLLKLITPPLSQNVRCFYLA